MRHCFPTFRNSGFWYAPLDNNQIRHAENATVHDGSDHHGEESVDAAGVNCDSCLRWRVFIIRDKSWRRVRCMSRCGLPSCVFKRVAIKSNGEFSEISKSFPFNCLFEVSESTISRFSGTTLVSYATHAVSARSRTSSSSSAMLRLPLSQLDKASAACRRSERSAVFRCSNMSLSTSRSI